VTFRQVGNIERDQDMLAALGLTVRPRWPRILRLAARGGASSRSALPLDVSDVDRSEAEVIGFLIDGRSWPGPRRNHRVLVIVAASPWRVASVTRDCDAVRRPSTVTRAAANAERRY
jgi:hypothetical protein